MRVGPVAHEDDVAHLVQLVRKMFKIGKRICYDHSMGGYGAWRMTVLHPELSDAAIVVAGRPDHITRSIEKDMRYHVGSARELSLLVVHGTEDRSRPIEPRDDFVAEIVEAEYNVSCERVPGAGHMDVFPAIRRLGHQWIENSFRLLE